MISRARSNSEVVIKFTQMGGKAIFCGDIPLHRPYIGLIYGRYLQFRILKWPLT